MEKNTAKKHMYGKTALAKALKGRLCALTQALGDAEVGGKGIDIVKEIKELQGLLDIIQHAQGADNTQNTRESPPLVVVWGSAPSAEHVAFDALQTHMHGGQHDTSQ